MLPIVINICATVALIYEIYIREPNTDLTDLENGDVSPEDRASAHRIAALLATLMLTNIFHFLSTFL